MIDHFSVCGHYVYELKKYDILLAVRRLQEPTAYKHRLFLLVRSGLLETIGVRANQGVSHKLFEQIILVNELVRNMACQLEKKSAEAKLFRGCTANMA